MRQLAEKNTGHDAMGASAQRKKSGQQGGLAADIASSPAMLAQRKRLDGMFGGAIQRKEDEEPLQGRFEAVQRKEDEEPLQGKFAPVQRVEDEEPLQGRFETAQRVEDEEPLQGKFEAASAIQRKGGAARPNNTGLPDNLKSGIESLSGMSMDNVKVHYNSSQPAQLNAHAYAQGTDIHVAPGQEQHLPHEAWHVVQQAQGRVQPTMQMKQGVPVNDDHSLEHEADVMGAKASEIQLITDKSAVTKGETTSLRNLDSSAKTTQRMSVRGDDKNSEVSGTTSGKHVVALDSQADQAKANFGATTFVTSNADLTGPVDADGHDFTEATGTRSARHDINASVKIYLYDKTNPLPAGLAKDQPVSKSIDGVATNCEIGAEKGGDDKIKITHFKKL